MNPADHDPSRSGFIFSNLPASTGQAYYEVFGHQNTSDVPLDAFDKELLATGQADDHNSGASLGLARVSFPPKLLTTPRNSSTARQVVREELHATPQFRNTSSSSLGEDASSPTVVALSQRKDSVRNVVSSLPLQQNHSSPLSRKDATTSFVRAQVGDKRLAPTSRLQLGHAPPVVQGIPLVSVNDLPDRLRSLFPFALFNAVQSRCFATAFKTDENLVLSAPTGSGKTVIMELAICYLMHSVRGTDFKIVYQAPTKALCSERCADWQAKFGSLDLQCAELTGDTDASQMRNVQAASIIITTPEKWDSITRRWKDHEKLMRLIKLFLIDEVHMLKESRGATLEAVVSRMKSTGTNVRFIALSATVPNSEDVAIWLGKDSLHPYLPAHREVFGEEFRPVQLQKVVYGYSVRSNDFVFDNILESKLPEIIAKHSQRKPIIIFCPFRKSCFNTAKSLAQLWKSTAEADRLWSGPSRPPGILDNHLREFISAGVAFHHAGLDGSDRRGVEQAFLSHNISIICCTSTLAVGVNLPCYLVVIKGTAAWSDNGCQEYADLETMQMLGRAGRPQFDQSACAVILTRNERVDYYNRLVSGQEALESCLHLNLIDHLNAEIGLGTVTDLVSAKRWLASTFLYVRLSQNPNHYKLKEDVTSKSQYDLLDQICSKDITLLQAAELVTEENKLSCTEFGDAMARYYVKFDTMKTFLSLAPRAKLSEILSSIAQAAEFRDIRLKSGEKSLYKHINKDINIKFSIKVDIALPAHKVSLLLQSELGGVDFPVSEQFAKHKNQFQQDKAVVFQHVNRLIRCFTDCQLTRGDSVSARHALELARSFAARVWDNSPLQLRQLDQIGNVAVRKLANAGINSIESLENTEAHRIEKAIGRGPPFGMKILSKLAHFPNPRLGVKMVGKEIKPQKCIRIRLKAEIGFMNEHIPVFFRKKLVYTCFLAETSDGQILDFRRIPASKLQNGHEILLTAELTKPSQYILCHIMCDEIAGTCRTVEERPDLPASLFPTLVFQKEGEKGEKKMGGPTSGQQQEASRKRKQSEEFGENGLDDGDLLAAEHVEVMDIDAFEDAVASLPPNKDGPDHKKSGGSKRKRTDDESNEPVQLQNGKWACNHPCKDKTKCKHLCCKEGLDKPPKPSKKVNTATADDHSSIASMLEVVNNDSTGWASSKPTKSQAGFGKPSLDHGAPKPRKSGQGAKDARNLTQLHEATTPAVSSHALKSSTSKLQIARLDTEQPSAFEDAHSVMKATKASLDKYTFDSDWANEIRPEDLADLANSGDSFTRGRKTAEMLDTDKEASLDDAWLDPDDDDFDFDGNDVSMLEASMVGLDDSVHLKDVSKKASTSRHNDTADVESNAPFSSATVHESTSSKIGRLQEDDVFADDGGLYDFDQENFDLEESNLIRHKVPEWHTAERPTNQSNDNEPVTSPSKKLFFTSPERPRHDPNRSPLEDATSQQSRRAGTPSSNLPIGFRSPLQTNPLENVRAPGKLPDILQPRKRQPDEARIIHDENETGNVSALFDKEAEKEVEGTQKLQDSGIDQSFYDEFKDFVEFV